MTAFARHKDVCYSARTMAAITISPVDVEARKALDVRVGDTVRVWQKIVEDEAKGKFRLQAFEGLVIARKHGTEPGATFTVRRVASGVGVERIFPLYSPVIDRVELLKRARVRRAKLYYIRDKAAREARKVLRRQRVIHSQVSVDEAAGEPGVAPEVPETPIEAARDAAPVGEGAKVS